MHELSVIKALIDTVETYTGSKPGHTVKTIAIEVGSMTCVDPDRLTFCFDMVKAESGFNTTRLRIVNVAATAKCRHCGNEYKICQFGEACTCGSYQHDMLTGSELNLTEIEFV